MPGPSPGDLPHPGKVKVTQWCLTLWDPVDYKVQRIVQARTLEWVAFPLSRGSSQPQGLNPGLPHCRWILYQLSHQGSPTILEWVAYPFSRGSSRPRNRTGVSCIAQPSHQGSPYTCTPVFTRAMTQQQPKCPSTEEWSNKMWYTHNGILLSHEKEQS